MFIMNGEIVMVLDHENLPCKVSRRGNPMAYLSSSQACRVDLGSASLESDHDDRHGHDSFETNHENLGKNTLATFIRPSRKTSSGYAGNMQDLDAASEPRRSTCDAYILENSVFHARHLPASSKHAFKYPTLALLLRLSSLESHSLDLCSGRLFGYSDAGSRFPWARITGIRPEAYLHDPESSHSDSDGVRGSTIREKLNAILRRFKIDPSDVEDAWMLTMPSYLGLEGINPLTVYFCYKGNGIRGVDGVEQGDPALCVVILEVPVQFSQKYRFVKPSLSRISIRYTTHSARGTSMFFVWE